MSQKGSKPSSKVNARKRQKFPSEITRSKIPIPAKLTIDGNLEKGDGNERKARKVKEENEIRARPVKIAEPHQLPSSESCSVVLTKGSEGDHVPKGPKCGNSGDDSNGNVIHSLDILKDPRFPKETPQFRQIHSSFKESSEEGESLDTKNKEFSLLVGDGIKDDSHSDSFNLKKNLRVVATRMNTGTVNILKSSKKALNPFALDSTNICEIFPQVLLLIPDVNRRGGYITEFNVVNQSKNLLAYKVCLNESAAFNYIISPLYGLIGPLEMLLVEVRTSRRDGDRVGGFSQKSAKNDRLEIKTVESIGVSSNKELWKFWNVAELRFPQLIKTTVIDKIKVLEPCNMSMLKVLDEGEERSFIQKALEEKYNKVLFPQMSENRECHSIDNELIRLENRAKSVRQNVRNSPLIYLTSTFAIRLLTYCFLLVLFTYYYLGSLRIVPLSLDSFKLVNTFADVNRAIINILEGIFF